VSCNLNPAKPAKSERKSGIDNRAGNPEIVVMRPPAEPGVPAKKII